MAEPKQRTELTVGIFVFVGLVLLGGLIVEFSRFEEWFGGRYSVTVVFADASGVIKGSEVRMGGARIGQVAELPRLTEEVEVEVDLAIDEHVRIPVGSEFRVDSATLLGDKLIVVTPPAEREGGYLEPGATLHGSGVAGFGALQNNAEILSRKVVTMIEKAGDTMEKIDAAVVEIEQASVQVREVVTKVNESVLTTENIARLDSTVENVESLTKQWDDASSELGPALVEARQAVAAIKDAAERAERTMASADETLEEIQPALAEVPDAVRKFSATAEKAGHALDQMESGEGLLGTVTNDKEVSTDAKVFVKNLRKHGILRYQDDAAAEDEDDPRDRFRGRRR